MDKKIVKLLANMLELMNDLKILYDSMDKKLNALIAMNSEELDWMHEDNDYSTDYTCDDCDCSDCDDEKCPVNKIIIALKEDEDNDDECTCDNCDDTDCPNHPNYKEEDDDNSEEDEDDKIYLNKKYLFTKLISSLLDEYMTKYGGK